MINSCGPTDRQGSPRVHPSHSPTLAKWRSPSRSASTTSSYFKDALEHLLEDAAWGLPHAAVTTNHEQQANLEPCTPALTCYSHLPTLMQSARPETSRFPMTRTAPRFAPATSAQRTPELRTRSDIFFLTTSSRKKRCSLQDCRP
jgi:hypothetical protein